MNQGYSTSYDAGLNRFFSQIYLKVALGIGVSAVVSFIMLRFMPMLPIMIYSSFPLLIVLILAEVMICFMCSRRAYSGNPTSTMIWYMVYSVINAISLTALFEAVSDPGAITKAFISTAITFVIMSIYGRTTKRNLSAWRNFLLGTGWGIIIALLINFFLGSSVISLLCSIVSVVLFAAYMAYDTQMAVRLYNAASTEEELKGLATYSAMALYMDLVDMFINLVYLFSDNDN